MIVGAWDYLNKAHTEWYKADFKKKIRQSVKVTLLEDLGIDRSKVEESSWRSGQAYDGHDRYARFKPNGKIPLDDCTAVRPIATYRVTISYYKPTDGDRRWQLSIPLDEDEKDTERFDVTEYIKIIFAAGGCTEKGLFAKDEYMSHYTADPALFRWELKPGVELAIGGFDVIVYEDADYSSVHVDSAVILYRNAE